MIDPNLPSLASVNLVASIEPRISIFDLKGRINSFFLPRDFGGVQVWHCYHVSLPSKSALDTPEAA